MTTRPPDADSRESEPHESSTRSSDRGRSRSDSYEPREDREGRRRHRGHRSRKERVLHTRISEQLAEDIREFAEDLRVPASNLVRNVLEEVFTVVNSVSGDVGHLMDDLVEEAEGVRDRIRRQTRSRRSHARSDSGGSRGWRRDRSGPAHQDVEDELRRDEERESQAAADVHVRRARAGASESARSESASPESGRAESARAGSAHSESPHSESVRSGSARSAAELFPDILGWQPLVLNRDFDCGRCKCALHAGDSAFLGLGQAGLTDTALCGRCASSRAQRRTDA